MDNARRYSTMVLAAVIAAALCANPGCDRQQRPEPAKTAPVRGSKAAGARRAVVPPAGATAPATRLATATAPATRAAKRRVHVFVSGRVQGVGFRAFTRYNAIPLKLTGWVKNLRDGRVEAVIEGPADKVDKLLDKIRTGPPSARVDSVQVTEAKFTGDFKGFEVRR